MKDEHDDIIIEASTEEGEALRSADKVKQLHERIKELEKEKTEYLDGWQRARADYANLQKTTEEDKKRLRAYIEQDLIEELIPTVDSFLMAFSNKESWEKVDPNWRTGVEYIYQQLMNTLEGHSLKLFGEVGDTFDPARYEAVSEEPVEDASQDHRVAKVMQKGFLFADQVIRPARVIVYTRKQ